MIADKINNKSLDWCTEPRARLESYLDEDNWFLHNDCLYALGLLDELDSKYEDALEHYTRSARLGNTLAMVRLGHLYVDEAKRQCCSWLTFYTYTLINCRCFVPWRTEQGEKAAILFKLAEALGNSEAKQIMTKARSKGDMVLQIRPGI